MRCLRVHPERSRHPSRGHPRTFPLPPAGRLRLGAASDNDLVVTMPGVSRRHAELTVEEDGVLFVDLGSKNRLIVGEERRDRVFLGPGDTVRIGDAMVSLEDLETADGELALSFGSSSSRGGLSGRDTEAVSGLEPVRSAKQALALVRRYERRPLGGERDRFLARARQVLGASALLRCRASSERTDEDGLVIEEAEGQRPAAEVCAELVRLPSAIEPRSASLDSGPTCLWLTYGSPDDDSPAAADPILVALYDKAPEGGPLPAWTSDFLAYVAGRLIREEPADEPAAESTSVTRMPAGELSVPPGMVLGSSPAMLDLIEEIRAIVDSHHDLLLYGETGTGKELFARLLHGSGPTGSGPFVPVNCAAIPAELLEAELFGVEKGAATGVSPRPGRFRQAEGGTLLLDEIADLPAALQPKLLRALQEREVLPLGAARPIGFDLRVISTSNCQLQERVAGGAFRADLFYRLDRLRLTIPPLRTRLEDLPLLATTFARRAAAAHGRRIRGLSVRALEMLEAHPWPGNVRELEAVVTRAVVRCRSGVLEGEHFSDLTAAPRPRTPEPPETSSTTALPETRGDDVQRPRTLKQRLEAEERRALREALAATGGNRTRAAKRLRISRQGLIDKLRRLGLDGEDRRRPRPPAR